MKKQYIDICLRVVFTEDESILTTSSFDVQGGPGVGYEEGDIDNPEDIL